MLAKRYRLQFFVICRVGTYFLHPLWGLGENPSGASGEIRDEQTKCVEDRARSVIDQTNVRPNPTTLGNNVKISSVVSARLGMIYIEYEPCDIEHSGLRYFVFEKCNK